MVKLIEMYYICISVLHSISKVTLYRHAVIKHFVFQIKKFNFV